MMHLSLFENRYLDRSDQIKKKNVPKHFGNISDKLK